MVRRERGHTESCDLATRAGQRDSIRLADGTHVLLGPASELRVVGKQPHGKQPDHAGGEGNAVQKI